MPVFTFSTKTKRPTDTEIVERIKEYCEDRGMNFSALVVELLKQWESEHGHTRSDEV